MRLVSKPDCLNWCRQREISISEYDHLYYERVPIHSLVFDLPSRSLEIIGLSNVLSRNLEGDSYSGSLVWLRDWDIWSEDYEEVGCRLASRLFSDPRRPTRFPDAPGQVFDSTELLDQRVALIVPMLFQWDAYLVPGHGKYVVFVSHDEYVDVVAKTANELDRLFQELHAWNPTKKASPRLRHIGESLL